MGTVDLLHGAVMGMKVYINKTFNMVSAKRKYSLIFLNKYLTSGGVLGAYQNWGKEQGFSIYPLSHICKASHIINNDKPILTHHNHPKPIV